MEERLLVVARSGRMLAQAAARLGFRPLVVDLYADLDTRACAAEALRVPSLAWADVSVAVRRLADRHAIGQAVYGGGFEGCASSLRQLAAWLPLAGNSPEVFAQVSDKTAFYAALAALGVPFPAISRRPPPPTAAGWLVKPSHGLGGAGVRRWPARVRGRGHHWQRERPGVCGSLLFCADGVRAWPIGHNRQWTADLGGGEAFVFAGMVNRLRIAAAAKARLWRWVARMTRRFGLRGLNSVDFIVESGRVWVLEVNARPPCSMQLYADAWLGQHLAPDAAVWPRLAAANPAACRGYQVVYAPWDLRIPPAMAWPEGCVDLPPPGARCRKGQPVCSIIADRADEAGVLDALARLRRQVLNPTTGQPCTTQPASTSYPRP